MHITFTGHQVHTTDALKKLVSEKFEKLQRHCTDIQKVHVTFHVEHLSHIVEANIHLPGNDLHARAEAADMYAAIDDLVHKLDRQLAKIKERS